MRRGEQHALYGRQTWGDSRGRRARVGVLGGAGLGVGGGSMAHPALAQWRMRPADTSMLTHAIRNASYAAARRYKR